MTNNTIHAYFRLTLFFVSQSAFVLLLNIILFNQYPILDGLHELSIPISLLYQVSTFLSIGSAACSLALLRKMKTDSHYSATQAVRVALLFPTQSVQ